MSKSYLGIQLVVIHDFSQPLIDEEDKVMLQKTSTVYLMLTSLGVDTSQREILYKTFWSEPMPSNDKISFCSG